MMDIPEAIELMNKIGDMWDTGIRKQLNIPDSYTKCSSTLSNKDYDRFIDCIGEENFIFVSETSNAKNTKFEIWISQKGVDNIKDFVYEDGDELNI